MSGSSVKIGFEVVLEDFNESEWMTLIESKNALGILSTPSFYSLINRLGITRTRQKRRMYYNKSQIMELSTEWAERRKIRIC